MPKIVCPVCEGTQDANHDLPANEYVHYPCQSCKNGIKNYCKACDGQGTYWENKGWGDCGILEHCKKCGATGYERDFIEIERDCERCTDEQPKPKKIKQEENGFDLLDFFDDLEGLTFICGQCNGTKKYKEKIYEDNYQYEKAKAEASRLESIRESNQGIKNDNG